jgi:hypothetical protein
LKSVQVYLFATLLLLSGVMEGAHLINSSSTPQKDCDKKPLCLRGKVVGIKLVRENKDSIVFDIKLSLEVSNLGDKPVIILQREFWLGATALASSPRDAAAYKYLHTSGHWPSISTSPEWKALRRCLNQSAPPPDLTRVLKPGESQPYETSTSLYIEKAGSFDKTKQSWDTIKQASPVWLQVTLEMWPVNLEPRGDMDNPGFGKILQQRWQRYGVVQLGRLTSEPMQLQLLS